MSLSFGFTSQQQLDSYVKCLLSIKPGDQVDIYLHPEIDVVQTVPTSRTIRADAVGIAPPEFLVFLAFGKQTELFPGIIVASDNQSFATIEAVSKWWLPAISEYKKNGGKYDRYNIICWYLLVAKIIKRT